MGQVVPAVQEKAKARNYKTLFKHVGFENENYIYSSVNYVCTISSSPTKVQILQERDR